MTASCENFLKKRDKRVRQEHSDLYNCTKCFYFSPICTKIVSSWGSAPYRSRWGAYIRIAACFWGKVGEERWKRWGFSAGRGRRKTVHIWGLGARWLGEGWEEGRIWGLSTGGALQVGWTWGLGWRAKGRLGRPSCKIKNSPLGTLPRSLHTRWRVRQRSTQSSVMKATEGVRHLYGPPWQLKNQIWPAVKKGWEPLN